MFYQIKHWATSGHKKSIPANKSWALSAWSGRNVDLKGGLLLVRCNDLHTPLIHDKITHPKFR